MNLLFENASLPRLTWVASIWFFLNFNLITMSLGWKMTHFLIYLEKNLINSELRRQKISK